MGQRWVDTPSMSSIPSSKVELRPWPVADGEASPWASAQITITVPAGRVGRWAFVPGLTVQTHPMDPVSEQPGWPTLVGLRGHPDRPSGSDEAWTLACELEVATSDDELLLGELAWPSDPEQRWVVEPDGTPLGELARRLLLGITGLASKNVGQRLQPGQLISLDDGAGLSFHLGAGGHVVRGWECPLLPSQGGLEWRCLRVHDGEHLGLGQLFAHRQTGDLVYRPSLDAASAGGVPEAVRRLADAWLSQPVPAVPPLVDEPVTGSGSRTVLGRGRDVCSVLHLEARTASGALLGAGHYLVQAGHVVPLQRSGLNLVVTLGEVAGGWQVLVARPPLGVDPPRTLARALVRGTHVHHEQRPDADLWGALANAMIQALASSDTNTVPPDGAPALVLAKAPDGLVVGIENSADPRGDRLVLHRHGCPSGTLMLVDDRVRYWPSGSVALLDAPVTVEDEPLWVRDLAMAWRP